jgi:ATP phosphoribosyltransferase
LIRIAVPNKGRMYKPTIELLKRAGFELKNFNERKLCADTTIGKVNIYFIRTDEIADYVNSRIADIGITGYDTVIEKQIFVEKLLDLSYGNCKVVLAGPKGNALNDNITIATKFTNITKNYLRKKKISAKIIQSNGATEIKPSLGLADFIVDITSTGSTLKQNNLVVYDTILNSNAVLIANKKSMISKSNEINEIVLAIKSVILAENKSYLMFNISKEILKKIIKQIPCMRAPTILNTGDDKIVSVQTVVPTNDVSKIITELKSSGTTDILVMDIKRVVV